MEEEENTQEIEEQADPCISMGDDVHEQLKQHDKRVSNIEKMVEELKTLLEQKLPAEHFLCLQTGVTEELTEQMDNLIGKMDLLIRTQDRLFKLYKVLDDKTTKGDKRLASLEKADAIKRKTNGFRDQKVDELAKRTEEEDKKLESKIGKVVDNSVTKDEKKTIQKQLDELATGQTNINNKFLQLILALVGFMLTILGIFAVIIWRVLGF